MNGDVSEVELTTAFILFNSINGLDFEMEASRTIFSPFGFNLVFLITFGNNFLSIKY